MRTINFSNYTVTVMRHLFSFILCLLFSVPGFAVHDDDLFENDLIVDSLKAWHKPILQDHKPDVDGIYASDAALYGGMEIRYMRNRRALVGDSCTVNRLVQAVTVGGWDKAKGNLLDEDLDNYAEFNRVIGAGVTVDPVVSIRDMRCYYAKGTQAGFAIVAGSGNAVLTLDVVRAYSIGFYRNGHLVGVKAIEEGQGGEGIALKLIQIPGSDDAVVMFTATSDWVFDEVQLDRSGGIQAGVGDLLKVKYAFAGRARSFYMGTGTPDVGDGIKEYRDFTGRSGIQFPALKGWNPVLLGIPFPFTSSEAAKMCDGHSSTGATITPILAAGYQGGAKFTVGDTGNASEVFPAGTEVGWKYKFGSGLSVDVGTWIRLILFDRNGNKVQEETVSAEVLGLSVAKGGDGTTSLTSSVPFSGCEIRFHTVLSINLGAIVMYNAFVRMSPDISHHCPINPTMRTNICEEQNSFQLRANEDLTVTWTLEEYPLPWPDGQEMVQVTSGGYVTNMNAEGEYVFKATASDGCCDYVVIERGGFGSGLNAECGMPLTYDTDAGITDRKLALSDKIYDSSGSLISISDIKDKENILDKDWDNYATYTGGLSLASNIMVVGVKTDYEPSAATTDPDKYYFADFSGDASRSSFPEGVNIGFVIENDVTGLDLSLLQFLQIRCYNNGEEVYRSVITENNGVGVGLAGSDQVRKVRYAITVPWKDSHGNYIAFNEFQLWNSGVLNLNGGHIRIYYAYMESAAAGCNNPLGCSAQMLGTTTHTTLNADESSSVGVLTVATAYNNLSNFIDDDPESYMTIANTVNAGGVTIAVNLGRTLDYRHELGVIMDNKTYVASIGVGSWLKMKTYYHGVDTGEEFTDWSVLGADVAGYGDKNFLYIHPQARYDEVRITIAGVANALDIQKYYGLFVRGDIDNDGVPDCQDANSCVSTIQDIAISPVCAGETITVSGKGTVDTQFSVMFSEPDATGNPHRFTATSDGHGNISFSYLTNKPGYYDMVFYDGSGHPVLSCPYSVHPLQTTWRKTATDSDWNKWDNWSDGTPYCCTDVIIPTGAAHYPVLDGTVSDEADDYCVKRIHMEPETKVDGVNKLNYESAWVEASLMPNMYHMMAAPLRRMYTGDWFAPVSALPPYFTPLDAGNAAENRFNPTIYQRLWDKTAKGRLWGSDYQDVDVTTTHWTREFNALAYEYPLGSGFSLWVDNGSLPDAQPVLFRMPKTHTKYWYYSDYDQSRIDGVYEDEAKLLRTADGGDNVEGRFAYEAATPTNAPKTMTYKGVERKVYEHFDTNIILTSETPANAFVFGNPGMCEIDVAQLLIYNGRYGAQSVGFYDGNTTATVSYDFDNDILVNTSGRRPVIRPLESVWIYTSTPTTSLTINLNELAMGVQPLATTTGEQSAVPMVRLMARNAEGMEAGALMVGDGIDASVATHEAMMDDEVEPRLMIAAIQEGTLCDIVPMADAIPLAIVMDGEQELTLTAHKMGGFDWNNWQLRDMLTGAAYSLEDDICLGRQTTTMGRYCLQAKATGVRAASTNNVVLTVNGGVAELCSSDGPIAEVSVCDLGGSLLLRQRPQSPNASIQLPQGIVLIKVQTASRQHTYKVLVRQ